MDRVRKGLGREPQELRGLGAEEGIDALCQRGFADGSRSAQKGALESFYRFLGMEEEVAGYLEGLEPDVEVRFYPHELPSRGFFRDNGVHNNNVL